MTQLATIRAHKRNSRNTSTHYPGEQFGAHTFVGLRGTGPRHSHCDVRYGCCGRVFPIRTTSLVGLRETKLCPACRRKA